VTTEGKERQRWLLQWFLAAGCSTIVLLVLSGALQFWEMRVRDRWFRNPARHVEISPRLCLVLIDDRALERLTAPTAFWAVHLSQAAAALLEAGAVVGLDFLPYDMEPAAFPALKGVFPELAAAGDNPWLPLFEALNKHGKDRFVQGIYPPNFQDSVATGPAYAQYRPAAELLAMLGPQQLGFINLSRDKDGVLRRQAVLPQALREPLWGADSYPPFAARLAEVAEGQTIEPHHPVWKQRRLPLVGDGTLRVAYPSAAGKVPVYSLLDVLQWRNDPARMRREFGGKVVLIGPGSGVFQDKVETPIGEMFGVEAHSYLVNTLLTQQYVDDASRTTTVALCALLIALGATFGLGLTGPVSLVAVGLLVSGYVFALQLAFLRWSVLGPVLLPTLGAILAWATGAVLRARLKAHSERRIRNLFGRYVSPAVMEVLLQDPSQAALGAVGKRHITVLFSDINGFSTHCEKKTPEAIIGMLNRYFESMNGLIFRYGGTIKQFVGDEIMAMYGAPTDHPGPEEAAVLTAVQMIAHLDKLHKQDPDEQHGFYRIKVGIHCGPVILGNVGSEDRTEYAAVGDDVNLGSRIMGLTKALDSDILISKDVYDKVRHLDVEFVSKGSHKVKGRDEAIELYQVVPRRPR
jgi:adenylate cyclase